MNNFVNGLAKDLINSNKESEKDFLTGEKNLILNQEELEEKLLKFKNGKSYLGVWLIEGTILRAQCGISFKVENNEMTFTIPDWDSFISRVNAFHNICGPY